MLAGRLKAAGKAKVVIAALLALGRRSIVLVVAEGMTGVMGFWPPQPSIRRPIESNAGTVNRSRFISTPPNLGDGAGGQDPSSLSGRRGSPARGTRRPHGGA